jgi:hypothetical protein
MIYPIYVLNVLSSVVESRSYFPNTSSALLSASGLISGEGIATRRNHVGCVVRGSCKGGLKRRKQGGFLGREWDNILFNMEGRAGFSYLAVSPPRMSVLYSSSNFSSRRATTQASASELKQLTAVFGDRDAAIKSGLVAGGMRYEVGER